MTGNFKWLGISASALLVTFLVKNTPNQRKEICHQNY